MKLIALGDNVIDYYHNTQECFPGGNAVNVAVHAARLGAQAEYLGSLGDDDMAHIVEKALRENGVDISHCPVLQGRTTKVCRTDAYYDAVCHGIDLAMLSCKPMDKAAFAELCAPLHRRGVVHVLATMGAAGQMLSAQGKIVEKTTQMVEASDTMGAGDSFLAAFLCSLYTAGWQKTKPMPEQALLAALAAGQQVSARNCMAQGGFGCKAEISRDSIE